MSEIPLSKLQEDLHEALKTWYDSGTTSSPLDYLQLFRRIRARGSINVRQATNEILYDALETLAVEHQLAADLLRRRFLDGLTTYAVANQLNLGESTTYRKQHEALRQLALIIWDREVQASGEYQANLEKRLRLTPNVPLFGVEESLGMLRKAITTSEAGWIISIEGLGGIGKTSLAAALLRQPEITSRFYNVAWISAKQQDFRPGIGIAEKTVPALTQEALTDILLEQIDHAIPLTKSAQEKQILLIKLLKETPYLVVIDNLETVTDYQALLSPLLELANPTKFLLTSRYSLRGHPNVFCQSLDELGQADSFDLIKHEARVRGLSLLTNAPETDLERIYEVVGGNPLALKLVVGQISFLPLSQVLENLKQARGKTIDELYTFIYWQAWQMLTTAAQQLFLVMPVVQDGTLDQLMALTQLDLASLGEALQQLASLSLIQVGGDLEDRRYTIHRLTETFLLKEAIQWQSS